MIYVTVSVNPVRKQAFILNSLYILAAFALLLSSAASVKAADAPGRHSPMNAVSVITGYTYDPAEDIWFGQAVLSRLYDIDGIVGFKMPENLRFKLEGAFGASHVDNGKTRANIGAGIMALYYLDAIRTPTLRPYIEGGSGVVYTDYQVRGQDFRFNFNSQGGIGVEIRQNDAPPWFMAVRINHISNAAIGDENRGLNAVLVNIGRFF